MIKLNRMTAIDAKLDALMNKLGNQDRRMHSAHEVGILEGNEQKSMLGVRFLIAIKITYTVEKFKICAFF